jgi:hypothetical protein
MAFYKNVGSQVVKCGLTTIADGSPFTGSVTVYVTIGTGTQTIGSVGSGLATHTGKGLFRYVPSAAETDGEEVTYTFEGSGAVEGHQTLYPMPDIYTLLLSVKTETASIQADTNDLQARTPAALVSGRMDSHTGSMAADVMTATATASSFVSEITSAAASSADLAVVSALATAINNKTTNLPTVPADQTLVTSAFAALTSIVNTLNNLSASTVLAQVNAALEAPVPDVIPVDGVAPSVKSGIYMQSQYLVDRGVVGNAVTIYKPDGITPLFTLQANDPVSPTRVTRNA